jgi:hypothetical protein
MASDVLMHSSDTAGGDPALEKVKTVRVALVHLGPGATVGHERKGCEWLKGRSAVKAGPCDSPVWQTARGTSAWSLAVGPLPKGKWIELVQPRDAAGYAEVTYSARDGNELAFTVR